MKIREIQQLIDVITKSGLEEVHIEIEAMKLHVKRRMPTLEPIISAPVLPLYPSPVSTEQENTTYITIKSPMIGTFYRSPNPQEAPFVKEGDAIVKGTKLCIIEAMKFYNEVSPLEVRGDWNL
jgi:acetyl-CoA carboxylase biotin carboxyl carrier protein